MPTSSFIVAKFCFSSSDYLNSYKHFFFTLTVALLIVFFPQKFCVVYLNVTGYQIKAWNIDLIYIWMTKNVTFTCWKIKGI